MRMRRNRRIEETRRWRKSSLLELLQLEAESSVFRSQLHDFATKEFVVVNL